MTHQFNTTLGNVSTTLWKAKKVYSCGINLIGELQVQVFTNEEETAGYIVFFNLHTRTKRLERIKTTYISHESTLKYGRKAVTEILPIIKN